MHVSCSSFARLSLVASFRLFGHPCKIVWAGSFEGARVNSFGRVI